MFLSLYFSFLMLHPVVPAPQVDPMLMRINGRSIPRSEFIYKMEHDGSSSLSGKALKTYVDKYVLNQLKVSAAEAAGLDTLPSVRNLYNNYRRRLMQSYLVGGQTDEDKARTLYNQKSNNAGVGEVLVMEIYLPLSPNAKTAQVEACHQRMDSIYSALQKNPQLFTTFVQRYSANKDSLWIGSLDCPEPLENKIFALKTGQFSEPYLSMDGYRIIKSVSRRTIAPFDEIKDKLILQSRGNFNGDSDASMAVFKLKNELGYSANDDGINELKRDGETSKTLFTIGSKAFTGSDFRRFAAAHPMELGAQLDAFIAKSVLDVAGRTVSNKYPMMSLQLKLYRDELLAKVEDDISSRTMTDSITLNNYFVRNLNRYHWDIPRFNGAVLYCANKKVGKKLRKQMKKSPEDQWDKLVASFNNKTEMVKMEKSLFAMGDNAAIDDIEYGSKKYTPSTDYPYTYTVGKMQKTPNNYKEVLSQVQSDYKQEMQQGWEDHLRANGKVEISEEVLKTVNNHR